jgi:predicted O-methyltransferase YrrM
MSAKHPATSFKQTVRRVIRANRFLLNAAVRAADTAYSVRRHLGLVGRAKQGPVVIGEVASDLRIVDRYTREFSWVEGWFRAEAIATWDILLTLQGAQGHRGNLLEIGVLKGKSAALLALHARADETCVFVDPTLRKMATDVVESIRTDNNVWVGDVSQNLHDDRRLLGLTGTFRWIHIDGEHTGRAVTNDLEIARNLLSDDGIICLDDFMSPAYPQITAAAFTFLERHRDELTLFLAGFNKGYVCRTKQAQPYLRFLQQRLFAELTRRRIDNVTVWKSTDPADMNCFGMTAKLLQFDCRGPDWAPDTISI